MAFYPGGSRTWVAGIKFQLLNYLTPLTPIWESGEITSEVEIKAGMGLPMSTLLCLLPTP